VTPNPAVPNGTNSWYVTSPVVVNIAASDISGVSNANRRYRILTNTTNASTCNAAGSTFTQVPNNGNVSISTEGANVLCYQVTDNAGNVTTGNIVIRIDTAAPTATLSGLTDGSVLSSGYLSAAPADATPGSGGTVVTRVEVDGTSVSLAPINVATLALGEHTAVVTTRDLAGNVGTSTITFTVTTSYDSIRGLIDRYTTSGAIKAATANGLRDRLAKAEAQEAIGREGAAADYLEQFIARVNSQVSSTAVKNLLIRDARALIAELRS
jgi:hypothetical protein